MIVPLYWAEARIQERMGRKQLTVRRLGWSDESQEDAQAKAEARAREAFDRISAGESLPKSEPRVAYNGAEGVPIKEEILARHGDVVLTRNVYGAQCINTPDVLFADIDLPAPHIRPPKIWVDESETPGISPTALILQLALLAGVGWLTHSWQMVVLIVLILLFINFVVIMSSLKPQKPQEHMLVISPKPEDSAEAAARAEARVRQHLENFVSFHPEWHLRLYRTPAGFRVLVMHQTFQPVEAAAEAFFQAMEADPVYVRMCRNQQCFRARVSPKPWRIGIGWRSGQRIRGAVWPTRPERWARHKKWVTEYESRARGYASCRFIAALGSSTVDPKALAVQTLHDELCQAASSLPLA